MTDHSTPLAQRLVGEVRITLANEVLGKNRMRLAEAAIAGIASMVAVSAVAGAVWLAADAATPGQWEGGTTLEATYARLHLVEDDPRWNCHFSGNRRCAADGRF